MTFPLRALLSVSDKRDLVPFAQGLHNLGFELVASGGTAKTLQDANLPTTPTSSITHTPDLLGGRVKTLHPAIHAPILATRSQTDLDDLQHLDQTPFQLVVCNLYPFRRTLQNPTSSPSDCIESIDIGGVALLRAAAKNFAHVAPICDPNDYTTTLQLLQTSTSLPLQHRQTLALKAFQHTASYDLAISTWLASQLPQTQAPLPQTLSIQATQSKTLRYGENPHQEAALYTLDDQPLPYTLLRGKPLSYNNLCDLDAAWDCASSFPAHPHCIAIIKHTNPCGLAVSDQSPEDAFTHALASDPTSAFGSVIASSSPITASFVKTLKKLFVEALIAPSFTPEALELLAAKKRNCRAVSVQPHTTPHTTLKPIRHGLLLQTRDPITHDTSSWTIPTHTQPTPAQHRALAFAFTCAQHVKSNAIVLALDTATVGIGAGQMSRVDAVHIALRKAGDRASSCVLASDAFFPFPDALEIAARAGVRAFIQPGGSIRDQHVIDAANAHGVSMIFTHRRHFKH